eukprot:COSAG01_NODE_12211_length_1779_cov_1.357143_4_plen_165_part_00
MTGDMTDDWRVCCDWTLPAAWGAGARPLLYCSAPGEASAFRDERLQPRRRRVSVQPRRHPPGLLAAAAAVRRQRKYGGGATMPKLTLRHDPYVKARCGVDNPEHKQTKPCKRAGSSPVWTARHNNEMFLRRHPRDDNQCWIELWDWDRFGKDDFAGGGAVTALL